MLIQKKNAGLLYIFAKKIRGNEGGFTLIETLIALAILGLIAVAFLGGLATGAQATLIADERATAESLARSQMEYVKNYQYNPEAATYPYVYTYDETYNPNPVTLPQGYDISVVVDSIPEVGGATDIQKIRVAISREGVDILTVDGYKVDRYEAE